jgi:hypothetical protein
LEAAEKLFRKEALYQGTTLVVPYVAEKSYFLAAAGLRAAERSAQNKRFSALPKSSKRSLPLR